jgi:hypothetical protein
MSSKSKHGYTEKDAAKDTDSTEKEVNKTWHQARDDAAEDGKWGVPEDRHGKNKDNEK